MKLLFLVLAVLSWNGAARADFTCQTVFALAPMSQFKKIPLKFSVIERDAVIYDTHFLSALLMKVALHSEKTDGQEMLIEALGHLQDERKLSAEEIKSLLFDGAHKNALFTKYQFSMAERQLIRVMRAFFIHEELSFVPLIDHLMVKHGFDPKTQSSNQPLMTIEESLSDFAFSADEFAIDLNSGEAPSILSTALTNPLINTMARTMLPVTMPKANLVNGKMEIDMSDHEEVMDTLEALNVGGASGFQDRDIVGTIFTGQRAADANNPTFVTSDRGIARNLLKLKAKTSQRYGELNKWLDNPSRGAKPSEVYDFVFGTLYSSNFPMILATMHGAGYVFWFKDVTVTLKNGETRSIDLIYTRATKKISLKSR